jgi:site-specific recombinase XerD
LRRTFSTRLLQRGANPREMQEFMSHASPTTYTYIAKSGLHDALACLAEMPVDRLDRQQRG